MTLRHFAPQAVRDVAVSWAAASNDEKRNGQQDDIVGWVDRVYHAVVEVRAQAELGRYVLHDTVE